MNEQTALDNLFQSSEAETTNPARDAEVEFDQFVELLRTKGIRIWVEQSPKEIDAPDALFPNNWVSFHKDGRVGIYPMHTANRRVERREEILDKLSNEFGLEITEILDFTEFETHGKFLEGTGSLVLDRVNRIAYASLSERTDYQAVAHFCETLGYKGVTFRSYHEVDGIDYPIYHTNVMMCVASAFVMVCLEAIKDKNEQEMVRNEIVSSGKQLIELTLDQIDNFAGNALEVMNEEGLKYLVLSQRALNALTKEQVNRIQQHVEIIAPNLTTIEKLGGGSARCMMCEVFLPKF